MVDVDFPIRPRAAGQSLQLWIYGEIRHSILEGRVQPGSRLPSSRALAGQWQISRGTVIAAFDQLMSEGYLITVPGGGSFVSSSVPDDRSKLLPTGAAYQPAPKGLGSSPRVEPSSFETPFPISGRCWPARAFRPFQPDVTQFPIDLWARLTRRVLRSGGAPLLNNSDVAGYAPLRRAVADYLGSARGVRCKADNVVIVSGVQQALDLLTRLLVRPGMSVIAEDPLYPGAKSLFEASEAKIIPIPVDKDGMDVDVLRAMQPETAGLVYVTPANQSPMGVPMSSPRRQTLIEWACRNGVFVFEDDYDGEYRYEGHRLPALQGLDDAGLVIYAGTFTKVLFPGIRLGYVVLPDRLLDPVLRLRSLSDRFTETISQAVLATFIEEGHFARHVRRMREIYAARHDFLVSICQANLSGLLRIEPTMTGLETLGWLEAHDDDQSVASHLESRGLECYPLSAFRVSHQRPAALVLGFGGFSEAELLESVQHLASELSGLV